MVKICHLTSVHAWNDVRIFDKECRSLAKAGFTVHLVAARGPRERLDCGSQEGEAFVGKAGEVHVHLLDSRRSASRLSRASALAWRVAAYARKLNADLYHLHDPELLPHAALHLRERITVYDIHEDLALQISSKPWMPALIKPILAGLVKLLEGPLARRCDALVGATPEVLERFRRQGEGPDAVAVENAPRAEWFAEYRPDWDTRRRRVAYVGALTPERGLTDLVDAMADPTLKPVAHGLDLAGPVGGDYLAFLRGRPGFAKVTYHGVLDPGAVRNLLSGVRVGVATFRAFPNYLASRPIKISEYLASGIAIVASDFPLWRQLYGAQPGIRFVAPQDPAKLAQALAEALTGAAPAPLGPLPDWETEAEKLIGLYRRLTRLTVNPLSPE